MDPRAERSKKIAQALTSGTQPQPSRFEAISRALIAPGWQDRAKQTMVYGLAEDAWNAFTAPKRVYDGELDPMSDEAIGNMAELAGMVTLGAGAVPATGKHELRAGIKAYHGSPHDFDKFKMDKIGTGEGAQAYGHGLYFADSEDVARVYRDSISKSGTDGAQRRLQQAGGDIDAAISKAKDKASKYRAGGADGYASAVEEDLRFLEKFKQTGEWTPGRMYEVNINANPDDFLDWDKPLSQQPSALRSLMEQIDPEQYAPNSPDFDAMEPGSMTVERLSDMVRRQENLPREQMPHWASQELKQAGIPGIKYLDAGSRTAGEGSRNYVVFDENLIEIVRKYGVAGALAAGLLTQEQAKQFMAQQGPSQGEWEAAYNAGKGA